MNHWNRLSPEERCVSHPWKHSRSAWTGPWVTWSSWRCPWSVQERWTRWSVKVPSNPDHPKILWAVRVLFSSCSWKSNLKLGNSCDDLLDLVLVCRVSETDSWGKPHFPARKTTKTPQLTLPRKPSKAPAAPGVKPQQLQAGVP